MAWSENNKADYVFGFAQNPRLRRKMTGQLRGRSAQGKSGAGVLLLPHAGSRARRVVAKTEYLEKGGKPAPS
jgi:hypothetical protein